MSAWTYLYLNYYPLEGNVRRTSSIIFAERERGPEYEPDPDDMENLKKPDWWDDDYEPPERDGQEDDRVRPGSQERNWAEDDYYANLEQEYDYGQFQYPERYSWDQYA